MCGCGKKALEARSKNRDENIYFHFKKSKKAYIFHLFFGVQSLKYLLFPLICGLLFLYGILIDINIDEDKIYYFGLLFFIGLAAFFWICQTLYGIWKWKYEKNIVVTNEGIWIMVFSELWWNNSWDGKKHFLNASWSLYDWEEIEKLTVFTNRTARLFKLKNFKIKRWDGTQEVFYLKEDDINSLIELSNRLIKNRQKKANANNKFNKRLDFFERVVQFFEKEIEEK